LCAGVGRSLTCCIDPDLVWALEVAIPFKQPTRPLPPSINPESPLIPADERAAVEDLRVTFWRFGVWIDEFASTLELLAFCEKHIERLEKKYLPLARIVHTRTVDDLFGTDQQKKNARKERDATHLKSLRVMERIRGYNDWRLIAAKTAALALHDFGQAHNQMNWILSRKCKGLSLLLDAEARKDANKIFHAQFNDIYTAIRGGISHMQEKFGFDHVGMDSHRPDEIDEKHFWGLSLVNRTMRTTWKKKVHSLELEASTVNKMEALCQFWWAALNAAAAQTGAAPPKAPQFLTD